MATLGRESKRNSKTRTWWKRVWTILLVVALTSSIPALPAKIVKAKSNQSNFRIDYHVTLEKEDYPIIEVKVTNAPSHTSEFVFGLTPGGDFGVIKSNLKTIFKDVNVSTADGKSMSWSWKGNNEIVVSNSSCADFVIKYSVDALKWGFSPPEVNKTKFVLFRAKRIFFVAEDVFLAPIIEPSSITVSFSLPKGIKMFSSLPEKNGKFIATSDLFGNLLYDFQKAYFTGGYPIFVLTHYTKWGDKYMYIWFYGDPGFEAWLPSYGNTPWEQAEKYMETTEMFAKYYRENIGPLPQHTVLFTNTVTLPDCPPVGTNTDWFHFMQIWPRYSEPEIAHHVFHQYSFSFSLSCYKLSINPSGPGYFLAEGLNTYFEQVLPTLLLNDNHYEGKLFEFFALDQRGKKNGIRDNSFHNKYNISAMKVYLLDQYIQKVTNGKKSLVDFTKEMWNEVKNNAEPKQFLDKDVINAFTKIVGKSHKNYISQLAIQNDFDKEDFLPLLPDFQAYMNWMSKEYFWRNRLLFLVFLDIVSAKGEEWPHYATYPHNILRYRKEALTPFKNYLEKLNKSTLTEEDVVDAMNSVTGDHSGFFEFWKSYGIKLDPNSLLPLDKWEIPKYDESTYVSLGWDSAGALKTEHYLAGIPQKGEAILDKPDNDGKIVIEVRLQSFKNYLPLKEAKDALKGQNVSLIDSYQDKDENLFLTRAFFEVTTKDPEHKEFNFNLILPSFLSHPKFVVYNYPLGSASFLGTLYWLHSIDPIDFKVAVNGNTIKLPDTALKNEKFLIEFDDKKVNASANDTIKIPADAKTVKVSLLDEFGFLRGYKEVKIDTIPPKIVISSPANNSTIDTSKVPVSGTVTDNESGIDKVTVNGNNVSVSSDGSFSTTVNLTEGTNTITVVAIDKAGNKATKTITVTYEKPVQTIIITLQPNNPYMTVNGVKKEIDPGRGTKPVIIKEWGRTVVPIRAIVEALGGTISWEGTERKVTIDFNNTTIELWIDKPQAKVNGVMKWIDPKNHNVKPIIVNKRTMLPLRFVAESLGCTVDWNPDTKTITITYEG